MSKPLFPQHAGVAHPDATISPLITGKFPPRSLLAPGPKRVVFE